MNNPEILTTTPTKAYAKPRQLFKHQTTGEYCVAVAGANGRNRWISTHTKDYEEAFRRVMSTGVGRVISVANDDAFTDKVVEVLESRNKITLEQVVEEWLTDKALRIKSFSMASPRAIGKQLLTLYPTKTDIRIPMPAKINEWVNSAPTLTHRRRRLCVIEDFFQFTFEQGYRKDNPGKRLGLQTNDLTFDQMERHIKDPFTEEEYKQLLACTEIQGFWRWGIQLSWWLGFRMSDICLLQWGSFCAVPGKLVVWQQKTRRRMEIDLADPVLGGGEITRIMDEMRADISDAQYCFPMMRDLYNDHQPQTVQYFRECCHAAGLDGQKTFHCFRKSAALRWKAAGRSLNEIGVLLGHEGTAATAFYLETNGTKKPTPL